MKHREINKKASPEKNKFTRSHLKLKQSANAKSERWEKTQNSEERPGRGE
jgi:hypothetical protein